MSYLLENGFRSQSNCSSKLHEKHPLATQELNNTGPNCTQSSLPGRSTAPLSGNPYFTTIVGKSQVEKPYQLVIPRFFHKSLPNATLQGILSSQGKTWEVKYFGEGKFRRIGRGWKNFALENHLKVGDGCIFEIMHDKELKIEVQILNGQIPVKKLIKLGCSERPINLD